MGDQYAASSDDVEIAGFADFALGELANEIILLEVNRAGKNK